jgi:flagella basal body P-ring formation protein FlgA
MDDVIGARARRQLAAGEAVTAAVIDVPPLIKAGDRIALIVRVGGVEAEGHGTAVSSGHEGDLIRVLPPGTRRSVNARIVAAGRVEIEQ